MKDRGNLIAISDAQARRLENIIRESHGVDLLALCQTVGFCQCIRAIADGFSDTGRLEIAAEYYRGIAIIANAASLIGTEFEKGTPAAKPMSPNPVQGG